jgi:hypothetical protein
MSFESPDAERDYWKSRIDARLAQHCTTGGWKDPDGFAPANRRLKQFPAR